MKKIVYGAAAIIVPTMIGVLVSGYLSGKESVVESFQAYGFICLPIAVVCYFAGLRGSTKKIQS